MSDSGRPELGLTRTISHVDVVSFQISKSNFFLESRVKFEIDCVRTNKFLQHCEKKRPRRVLLLRNVQKSFGRDSILIEFFGPFGRFPAAQERSRSIPFRDY